MPTKSLAEWLDHQQRSHPRAIELGLERVRVVWERMGAPRVAPVVITVGGTNGKGSTVAFLEAMLASAGKRVGCYTSPHLLRYNERVRVAGAEVGDDALVDAFERSEAARTSVAGEDVALTYFEYGTLAALWIFAHAGLDVAVLEVGLGGRLDAVNIIDADAAIVTTVDLDHQDWLGADRGSIGREKAGIFRPGRPAVIGSTDAPAGLLGEAARIGAKLVRAGTDYAFARTNAGWSWQSGATALDLPLPALAAPCQVDNAAAALAALHGLRDRLGWNGSAYARGVAEANLAARLQRFARPERAEVVVDVAHNPQAAGVLAQWLREHPIDGRTHAVFGALEDKDVEGIVEPFDDAVDEWLLAGLDALTPRGTNPARLRERVARARPELAGARLFATPADALRHALERAAPADRIVAFGSFFVAAAALELLQE